MKARPAFQLVSLLLLLLLLRPSAAASGEPDLGTVEMQFRQLPMEAKRLTGPLFWLHGDESRERLEMYLERVAESGNGGFTAESRPHRDWLGPTWFRDLEICLAAAKKHDLQMWIFDEKWWPSQMIGGKVPPKYATKVLVGEAIDAPGGKLFEAEGYGGQRYVAAVAGKVAHGDAIDGASLVDLAPFVRDGKLRWPAPAGAWKVMKFTHKQGPGLGQGNSLSIDGASQDSTDYFMQTVYQPHWNHFQADFGKTIPGFFYDEPETRGDWGTELNKVLAEWKVDWKLAYVAHKFKLAGEDHAAARFQYLDAFAEAWGRTLYGTMSRWCREHRVKSMGHFMEHGYLYVHPEFCAGDMMRLQKYSDMGGIDLVCQQMYPGQRPRDIYQTPKLGSSITHVYGKDDDVTMCEMFGAYGQDITYSQMKWLTDQMQVRGVNFMIPHSFNPRAPRDTDCPPYFYNGGFEPRYPLYRVYADYTSRLALLLSGGRHVSPVAILFAGNLQRVGRMTTPEDITSSLQDALFDCDWLPMEVFTSDQCTIESKAVRLHQERYRVLVVPPVETIPYETLKRVKEFYDAGGVVVGCGFLPTRSATIGKTSADIAALRAAVWGDKAKPGTAACRTNPAGGRAYLLAEKPTPQEIAAALTGDAGVVPTLQVLQGDTGNWLHVLHRVKCGRDVFFVANQNHEGRARRFRFRATAAGYPEAWDAMRNEILAVPFERKGAAVEFDLALEPNESVLLVFQEGVRSLPARLPVAAKATHPLIAVTRKATPPEMIVPSRPPEPPPEKPHSEGLTVKAGKWIWHDEPAVGGAVRYFRAILDLPADRPVKAARCTLTCDNLATLLVNGKEIVRSDEELNAGWTSPVQADLRPHLKPGRNVLAVRAENFEANGPNPAGLIGALEVQFQQGPPLLLATGDRWKSSAKERAGWAGPEFNDAAWTAAKVLGDYGISPWGDFLGRAGRRQLTTSPVTSDPFVGTVDLPAGVDLRSDRVYLEMDDLPDTAASVHVNGRFAGGCLGLPARVNVTAQVKVGANEIVIVPCAPKSARLVIEQAKRP